MKVLNKEIKNKKELIQTHGMIAFESALSFTFKIVKNG